MSEELELVDLDKTAPVVLLERRRLALIGWIRDGAKAIEAAEAEIKRHKAETIETAAEIDQIEQALNVLNDAQRRTADAARE